MIQIVFSAFQRIDELPDDKKRRVTGIVVDIFQPFRATAWPREPSTST